MHLSRLKTNDFESGSEDLSDISDFEEDPSDIFYSFDNMSETEYEKYLAHDEEAKIGNIFFGTNVERNKSFESNRSKKIPEIES